MPMIDGLRTMISKLGKKALQLFSNSKGATAIEYGLIAALIAVAAIGAMGALGSKLSSTFRNVSSAMR
jgi:pilus assembly protein Flp/PilA